MNWINVKDRLPEDGQRCYIFIWPGSEGWIEGYGTPSSSDNPATWKDFSYTDGDCDPVEFGNVKYWLETPAHPAIEKEKK